MKNTQVTGGGKANSWVSSLGSCFLTAENLGEGCSGFFFPGGGVRNWVELRHPGRKVDT